MANPGQNSIQIFRMVQRAAATILALAIMFGLAGGTLVARAQTLTVLHTFGGGASDGGIPFAGVTVDVGGNLYGTTYYGGPTGHGTVYRLTRSNDNWAITLLYIFGSGGGGVFPEARVVIGPNGSLYGTTSGGLNGSCEEGCGAVFNLKPGPTPVAPWVLTTLYYFTGGADGGGPQYGDLVFDSSGAMYGTTYAGGIGGVIYKLAPSGQGYMESVLYSFTAGPDGYHPDGSVVFDRAGNLYTTASQGGAVYGTVVELTPSGGGWTESTIYSFARQYPDGYEPMSGLIIDPSGNLYGTTYRGNPFIHGAVYELMSSDGVWTESVLQGFLFRALPDHPGGPVANLVMDAAGNLYGTTSGDGIYGWGNVFELTPSNGGWTYSSLHDFTGGSDGAYPYGNLAFDAGGNLYGTTSIGGSPTCNCGVVWEIQMP